jgi:hypothetical protein
MKLLELSLEVVVARINRINDAWGSFLPQMPQFQTLFPSKNGVAVVKSL